MIDRRARRSREPTADTRARGGNLESRRGWSAGAASSYDPLRLPPFTESSSPKAIEVTILYGGRKLGRRALSIVSQGLKNCKRLFEKFLTPAVPGVKMMSSNIRS